MTTTTKIEIEKMTPEERIAFIWESQKTIQRVVIARCEVLARRHDKAAATAPNEKKAAKEIAKAAHHRGVALRLTRCGRLYLWADDDNNDEVATEECPKTGDAVTAQRTWRCGLSICSACHGRTSNHLAFTKSLVTEAEDDGATLYQLALHPSPPSTRAKYGAVLADADKKAHTLMNHPLWTASVVGSVVTRETSAASSKTTTPNIHLHVLARFHKGITTLSPELITVIETFGYLSGGHSPITGEKGGERFAAYALKSHSPKRKLSPLHGAPFFVVDGILEAIAAKKSFVSFHGTWAKPSKTAAPKATGKKHVPPSTKEEVDQLAANKVRPPKALIRRRGSNNVGHVSLYLVDSKGRKRKKVRTNVIVPAINLDDVA